MLSFADVFTAPSCLLAGLVITNAVFWPYFAGGSILLIGLVTLRMGERQQGPGFESLLPLGPVFVAVAMAIFGADHLTAAKFVAKIVPSWIPGQLFWAYFVGFALIAAALSLVTRVKWRLAAVLLGIMIFLFVLLIHIPSCFATPFDKTRLTIVLRDSALSAGILAFAVSQSEPTALQATSGIHLDRFSFMLGPKLITVARYLIAIVIGVFGIEQFMYPTFAPGIPQEGPAFVTMPAWIPGHVFWAYLIGAIFIVCAIRLMSPRHAHFAATLLGATVFVLVLSVYLPLTILKASDIANGLNYLAIHIALSGVALLLARALPANVADRSGVSEIQGVNLGSARSS